MSELFALFYHIGRCLAMVFTILTAIPVGILRFIFLWCKPIRRATEKTLNLLDNFMEALL